MHARGANAPAGIANPGVAFDGCELVRPRICLRGGQSVNVDNLREREVEGDDEETISSALVQVHFDRSDEM